MEQAVLTRDQIRTAYSSLPEAADVVRELVSRLGDVDATAVLFFSSPTVAGDVVAKGLTEAFPDVPVIGCTSAGEFTERGTALGGVAAVALPRRVAPRAVAALAKLDNGVEGGIIAAFGEVERQLGTDLQAADPLRYVGIVLIDGLHGSEERVNEVLGNQAPLLSIVGGSAGDDLQFSRTQVYCGGESSSHGAALLVLEIAVPFTVVKSCSFEPMDRAFKITEADIANRIVWALDGRPAAEVYAEAVGCPVGELDSRVFMAHPLGLMIDNEPWIRSPQQLVDGGGMKFYCQILPGMDVTLMRSTDLIAETSAAIRTAVGQIGGKASGAVISTCILRRLEIDEKGTAADFVGSFGEMPVAGFHSYGESFLGHINQTLTGIIFA